MSLQDLACPGAVEAGEPRNDDLPCPGEVEAGEPRNDDLPAPSVPLITLLHIPVPGPGSPY